MKQGGELVSFQDDHFLVFGGDAGITGHSKTGILCRRLHVDILLQKSVCKTVVFCRAGAVILIMPYRPITTSRDGNVHVVSSCRSITIIVVVRRDRTIARMANGRGRSCLLSDGSLISFFIPASSDRTNLDVLTGC